MLSGVSENKTQQYRTPRNRPQSHRSRVSFDNETDEVSTTIFSTDIPQTIQCFPEWLWSRVFNLQHLTEQSER
jgi:hypothetical protein